MNKLLGNFLIVDGVKRYITAIQISYNNFMEVTLDNATAINLPVYFLENGGTVQTSGKIIKLERNK